MDDKLRADIEAIVKSIFANREESEQRAALEQTLEKSASVIEELTTELSSKSDSLVAVQGEFAAYKEEMAGKLAQTEASIEAKDVEITALNEKLTAVDDTVASLTSEKTALADELNGIKLDQAAAARIAELTELKVARQDVAAQQAKVRAMNEEEYTAYKEELVAIRASILAELETAGSGAVADDDGAAPPANVDTAAAASAALNLETASSDTMKTYAELGKAMAEQIKNSRK